MSCLGYLAALVPFPRLSHRPQNFVTPDIHKLMLRHLFLLRIQVPLLLSQYGDPPEFLTQ